MIHPNYQRAIYLSFHIAMHKLRLTINAEFSFMLYAHFKFSYFLYKHNLKKYSLDGGLKGFEKKIFITIV